MRERAGQEIRDGQHGLPAEGSGEVSGRCGAVEVGAAQGCGMGQMRANVIAIHINCKSFILSLLSVRVIFCWLRRWPRIQVNFRLKMDGYC